MPKTDKTMEEEIASKKTIKAKELIELIKSTKPTAEVEGDEDCYVKPRGEIEVDDDGLCSLSVGMSVPTVPDFGAFCVRVGGVAISVGRDLDGPKDDYEFEGAEITYGGGLTVQDVIAAIEENVDFPDMSEFEMAYNDTDFDPDDVEESVETEYEVFAEDDNGDIYAFDEEGDIPDDMTSISKEVAIHRLVETWVEDGGEVDGQMYEDGMF